MNELHSLSIMPMQNYAAERVIRMNIVGLIAAGTTTVDVASLTLGEPVSISNEVYNTKIEVTTLDDPSIKEEYRNKTFTFKYNRANLSDAIISSVPVITGGIIVTNKTDNKVELIKAQTIVAGINTDNITFEEVTETTHFKAETPYFSNIDKGVIIKDGGSHLYVGDFYIPYIYQPSDVNDIEDPAIKEMLAKSKEMENLRQAEIAKQSEEDITRRQETLAAIKAADAEKLQGYKPSEHLMNTEEIINPSQWDIDDDFVLPEPVPEPEPVPPPPVPEPDEIPIPPPPPPTPEVKPQPDPHFNLGSFANVNDVAKSHMVATDTDETSDIRMDVAKANPDNPLLYRGAPVMRQAFSVADALVASGTIIPKQ